MTPREQVEYSELRATIRERGTARVWIFVVGMVAWGGLAAATSALAATPVATLLPLLVAAAAFEGVFALHVGVERIGRYLQVFYERDGGDARWEHTAMGFGRPRHAVGADALFFTPFLLAALFNLVPALVLQPTPPELIFIGGAHALFVIRLVAARAGARQQRAVDLARFEEIKRSEPHDTVDRRP